MKLDEAIELEGNVKKQLPWTGERLVTQVNDHVGTIEHLHRYAFAMEYVKNKVILDIASGEGYGSNLLAQVATKVIGVDISEEAVSFASQKYVRTNLEFKVGSADLIPLPDNCVDVVVSFETLEHHEKHEEMMQEVKRVLKPDGLMIISTPDKSIYHRRDPDNVYHVKELYVSEFESLIKKYFKKSSFLEQRVVFGSFLSSKLPNESERLNFYSGDFNQVTSGLDYSLDFLNQPFFILCLASDQDVFIKEKSFFDGGDVYQKNESNFKERIDEFQKEMNFINNSSILRLLRKVLKKTKHIFRF